MGNTVEDYIAKHWDDCVKRNRADEGNLIGLPYPYTVPSVGHFDEIYYWDTYFTNIGLIISGRSMLAKSNVDNMLYLVDRYGYMPNGNRTYFLKNSQPPFLSEMVRDIYRVFGDNVWLGSAYNTLKKEYNFWMTKRMSPVGLNMYGGTLKSDEEVKIFADMFRSRTKSEPQKTEEDMARHAIICCESGWDMNPRWGYEGYDYAPIDLNSLMYLFETNMAYFSEILETGENVQWAERAENRKKLMIELMTDENGILTDYNFMNKSHSKVFSAASLYPLYAGMADSDYAQLMDEQLCRLEMEYGLVTCEKTSEKSTFQWDYPNGWACLQHIAISGFKRYGYEKTAKRLAEKYAVLAEKIFAETGNLWEKYNVVQGSININQEDPGKMPPMMGWSAGVYLYAKKACNLC